jgi:hypothetical protein
MAGESALLDAAEQYLDRIAEKRAGISAFANLSMPTGRGSSLKLATMTPYSCRTAR